MSETKPSEQEFPTLPTPPRNKATLLAIVALIAVGLLAITSIYQFKQLGKAEKVLNQKIQSLQAISDPTHQQPLIQELNAVKKIVQILLQRERSAENRLTQSYWALAEAETLVRIASERLTATRDVEAAVRLLEMADLSIQSLHDPNLLPLRESLQADIDRLQKAPRPNLENLWMTLGNLIGQVDKLPTRGLHHEMTTKENPIPPADNTENKSDETKDADRSSQWQQSIANRLKGMKELVVLRRHQKTLAPLLSTEDAWMAKTELRLLLEQARYAIVSQKTIIYQQSLEEALRWVREYFAMDDPLVQEFLKQLQQLAEVGELTPNLPSLGSTLQRLQTIQGQRAQPRNMAPLPAREDATLNSPNTQSPGA